MSTHDLIELLGFLLGSATLAGVVIGGVWVLANKISGVENCLLKAVGEVKEDVASLKEWKHQLERLDGSRVKKPNGVLHY